MELAITEFEPVYDPRIHPVDDPRIQHVWPGAMKAGSGAGKLIPNVQLDPILKLAISNIGYELAVCSPVNHVDQFN